MAKYISRGSMAYIGTSAAAATVAQFETDITANGVEIGEIEDFGTLGPTANEVTGTAVGNGIVEKFKGAINNGTMALVVFADGMDAGQKRLKAAMKSPFDQNFHLVLTDSPEEGGTPTELFFRGKVMSVTRNIGNVDNLGRLTINIGINSEILEVEPKEAP